MYSQICRKNKFGYTALHVAAYNGNLDMFILLLSSGADYSICDQNGKTPFDILLKFYSKSHIKAVFRRAHMNQYFSNMYCLRKHRNRNMEFLCRFRNRCTNKNKKNELLFQSTSVGMVWLCFFINLGLIWTIIN